MSPRVLLLIGLTTLPRCFAQTTPPATPPQLRVVHESIEVTATRIPEAPEKVPAAIEVFTGEELRARGVRDLRGALALAIGVEIAPGGDAGPASAVPALWGLKEFDAFLLVVDGVPLGGAFNPGLTSLDLTDVERIEVLRGPAPVMYGATSFVGVIQVVHKDGAASGKELVLHGGSFGSGGASFATNIPLSGNWTSRLTLNGERQGFKDDRTAFRRGQGAWRVERKGADQQRVWFSVEFNWLDQDPASPRVRDGAVLSPLNPVDGNYNPAGAFLNDRRVSLTGGFARHAAGGMWSTTASVSHSARDILRGFLVDLSNSSNNSHGFREKIGLTDVYVDSHLSWKAGHGVSFLLGGDYLHGEGNAKGADFDYTAPLNGATSAKVTSPSVLDVHIEDRRDFAGAYGAMEWSPVERLRFDAGVRLNITTEKRDSGDEGGSAPDARQTNVRASGSVGAIFSAWQRSDDAVRFFVNYRDTFKPAAIDFGIGDSEAGILKPETAHSVEGGIKGRFFGGRLGADASLFQMNFENLVIATNVNGLPALANAGTERFRGFETGTSLFLTDKVMARATYSFHNAEFVDSVQLFGGVPTQLAGKRLEMSPRQLAGFGVMYTPARGVFGGVELNYTGSRYLNKRNTATADGFATVGFGVGYRTPRWELRLDGRNLADRRDPVAESEIGDAQYYLMNSRRVDVSFMVRF
jgi:outer membrane receptor protein involved in Fe transport